MSVEYPEQYQQTRHVLGSDANLKISGVNAGHADMLFADMWDAITRYEQRFSRFIAESELSVFNARAGVWTEVSPEFKAMLIVCKHYNRITQGLFNPFILPALQRAGYLGSWPQMSTGNAQLDVSARRVVSVKKLKLRRKSAKIPVDTALDFGGIGKGYMLDRLADLLEQQAIYNYCLSLGGDIICRGVTAHGEPWPIGIGDAHSDDTIIGTVTNRTHGRLAAATSGVTKRAGTGWNHVIDPRTGLSVNTPLPEATALAISGAAADVFAKIHLLSPEVSRTLPGLLGIFEQHADGKGLIIVDKGNYFTTDT